MGIRIRVALAAIALVSAVPAFATPPGGGVDFTGLTSGISFAGVTTAVLAVAGLKVLPGVAIWGSKTILGMVRR